MSSIESSELARLLGVLLEGIQSGRIPLESLGAFANSGRIEDIPGQFPIGHMKDLECPVCCNRTPHVLSQLPYSHKDLFGPHTTNWVCHTCGRKGPSIAYKKKE